MKFLYAARGIYNKEYGGDEFSWDKYIEWSKLTHLTELVSLDGMLNENLVEPDFDSAEDWNFIYCEGIFQTDLFTSVDFVFKRLKAIDTFNLLAVVLEPEQDCKYVMVEGFEFVGYELLDRDFSISALTNCGGFDETFLPTDLNDKGLIDDFTKAYEIKKMLIENNPDEHHADTNVIAVWRHKTIGR
ncbi:hypothetical protein GOQ30_01140 [Flavobacterium sp. TP390]|uniref:Uncharacterized protein n=1 Tax=Flavobacterium profundi TaxID=1774945 RepID=A0A6I4IDW8_9FLAO|nr:hypothetical protein [Flavobacterium profundi]MVO07765.1 hypothetical protein [Flavobacterium profundi]